MAARIKYLVKTYLWTVLVFIIAKVGFMLACHEGHVFTIADVWQVIAHGITLDLSTALYFLIVPFLVTIVSLWWCNRRVLQAVLYSYFIIIALAFALAFVADSSLYPFWGFKLDASCLQYLSSPDEAMASVSGSYLLKRLIGFIVIVFVIFRGYLDIMKKRIQCSWSANSLTLVRKFSEFAVYLLMIPVIIIGIRGGLDESTTNIGQVYYSQDQFLNHSAVNPVFSFLASFESTASANVTYQFMTEAACQEQTKDLYSTESTGTDTLLTTTRPNVVIILLESCGEVFTKVMPNLNRLRHEGIWFSNCYGNSYRTDRGTVCTLSGYPSFPTMSVMKMPKKTASLPSIARTLRQEGYQTSYLYGGDINFTNMRSYLVGTGWEKLHWKADYTQEEQNSAKWGVRDDITFRTLYDQIRDATATGRPFLIGYSTLSSHEPWDVPVQKLDDEKLNAFSYLDTCLGHFVDDLKASPCWENLLIVMLPDHGINYQQYDETRQERNHIPMLWIGGAVKVPRIITQTCNQTDLPATLLGQMQADHKDFTFSRDVLSSNYTRPFAFHCYNNGFSIVDSTGFTVYDLTSEKTIVSTTKDSRAHELTGKAILQITSQDLKNDK